MVDSRLKTSLHPVRDLHVALLPSACVAVIHLRTNERQTRNIAKAACAVGLPRIVKYTSTQPIWGVAMILSHVSLR